MSSPTHYFICKHPLPTDLLATSTPDQPPPPPSPPSPSPSPSPSSAQRPPLRLPPHIPPPYCPPCTDRYLSTISTFYSQFQTTLLQIHTIWRTISRAPRNPNPYLAQHRYQTSELLFHTASALMEERVDIFAKQTSNLLWTEWWDELEAFEETKEEFLKDVWTEIWLVRELAALLWAPRGEEIL